MREDADPKVKARATQDLRMMVQALGARGPVLVIPLLMAEGGIERGIPRRLKGLAYRWQPKGLLPHPKISEWIRARVRQVAASFH